MAHKEDNMKESNATATEDTGESNNAADKTPTGSESKGVLGSVWSAAGALAESVQHAVQGTIDAAYQTADRLQHDAEAVSTVGEYVAHRVADRASSVIEKTLHTAESVLETTLPIKKEPKNDIETWLSSPTNDFVEASKPPQQQETFLTPGKVAELCDSAKQAVNKTLSGVSEKAADVYDSAKQTVNDTAVKTADVYEQAKQTVNNTIEYAKQTASDAAATAGQVLESTKQTATEWAGKTAKPTPQSTGPFKLELTMDVVAHLQRIADRTGDKLLHETARKAHSACAKGLSEAPGVHLVRVTHEQATELVNLAIMTQDHELADFARYCQSVAATTQIGIEPTPGKIQEELAKGRQELTQQGRVHTGPGYGAAFASMARATPNTPAATTTTTTPSPPSKEASQPINKAAQPLAPQPIPLVAPQPIPLVAPQPIPLVAPQPASSSGLQLTMDMVAHLQRIADRTGDKVLHETARKAHSACAKNVSEAPGVNLVRVTPDQASELVNLAIRTQDPELANFARYCQSVAATTQVGIEPTPGKILEEIAKGRLELLQLGRAHTGPGYGAAFASVSRSNSQQNLAPPPSYSQVVQQQQQPQQQLQQPQQQQETPAPTLQLTMDVVAHLQRIADRTGDTLLQETARRAHSACAKNLSGAPGVHLTWVTPDQATELVNLAIRTQDHELADFARYCQSVAATTQVGVEPSPGKIREEIEKGRQELLQLGRAHTGPGYGAAFASAKPQTQTQQTPTPQSQPEAQLTSDPQPSMVKLAADQVQAQVSAMGQSMQ